MNGDLQTTRKLLAELREAYLSLPPHARANVTGVFRAVAQEQATPMTCQKADKNEDENRNVGFASLRTSSSLSS